MLRDQCLPLPQPPWNMDSRSNSTATLPALCLSPVHKHPSEDTGVTSQLQPVFLTFHKMISTITVTPNGKKGTAYHQMTLWSVRNQSVVCRFLKMGEKRRPLSWSSQATQHLEMLTTLPDQRVHLSSVVPVHTKVKRWLSSCRKGKSRAYETDTNYRLEIQVDINDWLNSLTLIFSLRHFFHASQQNHQAGNTHCLRIVSSPPTPPIHIPNLQTSQNKTCVNNHTLHNITHILMCCIYIYIYAIYIYIFALS